jgi:hypothetical protein
MRCPLVLSACLLVALNASPAPPIAEAKSFPSLGRDLDLSFQDRGAMAAFSAFAVNLCLFGGLILGGFGVVLLAKKRRRRREWLRASTLREEQAREALRAAERERSRIDAVLTGNRSIPCTLAGIGDHDLRLEAPSYANVAQDFVGRRIHCYFRIASPEADGSNLFLNFRSDITNIDSSGHGGQIITCPLPRDMYAGQKRSSLRLAPPRELILDCKTWPDTCAQIPATEFPHPGLHFGRTGYSSASHLADISATGMRIMASRKQLSFSALPVTPGKHWVIRLRVKGRRGNRTWWLLGRILKVKENAQGRVEIVFRFARYGAALDVHQRIEWRPLPNEEGVQEIAKWVFRRNTELVRESRAEDGLDNIRQNQTPLAPPSNPDSQDKAIRR